MWELAKGSSTITALASFNHTDGAGPSGGVIFDANGNLYGTTIYGGASNQGSVWELQMGTSAVPQPPSLVLALLALALMPLILRRLS